MRFVNPEIVQMYEIPNLDMGSEICGAPELVNYSFIVSDVTTR